MAKRYIDIPQRRFEAILWIPSAMQGHGRFHAVSNGTSVITKYPK